MHPDRHRTGALDPSDRLLDDFHDPFGVLGELADEDPPRHGDGELDDLRLGIEDDLLPELLHSGDRGPEPRHERRRFHGHPLGSGPASLLETLRVGFLLDVREGPRRRGAFPFGPLRGARGFLSPLERGEAVFRNRLLENDLRLIQRLPLRRRGRSRSSLPARASGRCPRSSAATSRRRSP